MMPNDDNIHDTIRHDLQVLDPIGAFVTCEATLTVFTDGWARIELASEQLGQYQFEDVNWWACFTRLRRGFERNGWRVLCNAARRDVCEPSGFGSGLRVDPFTYRVLLPPAGGRETFLWLDAFALADPDSVASMEQIESDRAAAEAAWADLQEHMQRVKAARSEQRTELLMRMPHHIVG
jgi:hypothetical protein